ncbi:hypothetical protein BGZ95_004710 [Linnemannia exigua]|uniref:protein S-acyltransferase n=1 Tax=Linnemannia exigua TaxID=604196 RepID=A0AAD4DH70_9FUNG|nr:hypothetical protein BGZ95_004710 [Linnemannia exigua]
MHCSANIPRHPHSSALTTSSLSTTSTSSKKQPALNLGLHSGAASGNLGLVKFALDNGQPIDSVVNGVLPIHAACCSNGNVPVVLFLIERGADVNSRRYPRKYSGDRVLGAQTVGTTGSTPLHFAAANGCLTIVEILLRHGATPDLADKYGSTPYTVATARNHPDVAALLLTHISMQRGLQVISPDLELRDGDPFTSPRSSGDFSRRISAVMAPTRAGIDSSSRLLPSRISTDVSSPQPPGAPGPGASRNIYQRRVSLPCIIESPSSPVASNIPRQSCDLGRPPLSMEPLHSRNRSTDSRLSGPSSRTSNLMPLSKMQQPAAVQTTSTINISVPPKPQISPVTPGARRCSADFTSSASSAGLLSPKNALAVNRRRSLDQMRIALAASGDIVPGARTADSKTRRDSDASTSDTIVSSGQSSCSTLVHPMMALADNDSRTQLDKMQSSPSSSPSSSDDTIAESPEIKGVTATTMMISSASSLAALRRASSASEPGTRSSLDLRSMTSPRQGNMHTKARHRRSMQEPLDASFFSPHSSTSSPLTSSNSTSSFGDSLPHIPKMDGVFTKHRASFSGSATVSGRFSRFWSYASGRESPEPTAVHSKDNSAGTLGSVTSNNSEAPWTMSDMGDGYFFSEKDAPANGRKSRNGVMNRLSGLWSRR